MRIAVAVGALDGLQTLITGVGAVVRSFVEHADELMARALPDPADTWTLSCLGALLVEGAEDLRPDLREDLAGRCAARGGSWTQVPTLCDGRVAARIFTGPDLSRSEEQWDLLSRAAAEWLLGLAQDHDEVLALLHDTPFAGVAGHLERLGRGTPAARRIHVTWIPHSLGLVFPDRMASSRIRFEQAGIAQLVDRGDCIGYVSDFYRQTLTERAAVPPRALLDLTNTIDTAAPRYRGPVTPAARAVLDALPTRARLVLTWGRCKPQKGFDEVLRAFRTVLDRTGGDPGAPLHLVMVAPTSTTEPPYLRMVSELVAELPADRVTVSHAFDESLPFAVLRDDRLHAVVLASRFEAFGLVASEAALLARPGARIVHSPIEAFDDQLRGDPRAVRLPAVDAEAIARALLAEPRAEPRAEARAEPGGEARAVARPGVPGPEAPGEAFVRRQAGALRARLAIALAAGAVR